MTTIEALQAFYVSKGGNFSDVENLNTIPEMIIAINEVVEPGTPVTTADIDDIIAQVN